MCSFTNLLYYNHLTVKYCIWSGKFHSKLTILMYSQDPPSKASWVLFQFLCITWELPGLGRYISIFWWGCFIWCFRKLVLCPPLSHSRIKHFLSRVEKQPEIFVLIAVLLTLQVTQNTNCLYHSSPFLSLVFSSSLLGDPSLLPKLSLPHSSRIADYMQKNNNQTNSIKEWKRLLKNHY